MSDSTAAYDLGKKFADYRNLHSIKTIVFAYQDRPLVMVYTRGTNDTWILQDSQGFDSRVSFYVHDVQIPMSDLYRGLSFEAASASPPAS